MSPSIKYQNDAGERQIPQGGFERQTADQMHSHPDIISRIALPFIRRGFFVPSDAVPVFFFFFFFFKKKNKTTQEQEETLNENQPLSTGQHKSGMTSIDELSHATDTGKASLGISVGFPKLEPAFTSRLYPAAPFSIGKNRYYQEESCHPASLLRADGNFARKLFQGRYVASGGTSGHSSGV